MIDSYIKALVSYALKHKLIEECDSVYCTNAILAILKKDSYDTECELLPEMPLSELLNKLCDYAAKKEIIEDSITYRDIFDTALMGAVTPMPSYVNKKFAELYIKSPKLATDWYYAFSGDTNYIRRDRLAKNIVWQYTGEYGTIDITVNLSKPEKDPKAIAAAKNAPQGGYPKCQLCRECEGYYGRVDFPARQTHRIVPVTIDNSSWFMQYSPYGYYNEHCILFNSKHIPMKVDKSAFKKLLDFTALFPHYFIGSNADLPIVGGSILSHEHFQGGKYEFAMERAPIETKLTLNGFSGVTAGIIKWPMSTIRLQSDNPTELCEAANKILTVWRSYSDQKAYIFAQTDGIPHNTITPIARRRKNLFELDLVLRNNITTDEHPMGLFHPHAELHHIKKENIGLIEVMGLAVLPPRLEPEMEALKQGLLTGADLTQNPLTASHAAWAYGFADKYDSITVNNIDGIIKAEIGKVFSTVLEHAGVFKRTKDGKEAFLRFTALL